MSNEVSEMWRDVHAAGADKRAANRESSADILRRHGVVFEAKNGGAHLIVEHDGRTVDFWPGTGLWHARPQPGRRGRGVFPLLRWLGVQANRETP